ncbi:MAG: hypothetical protein J5921_00280 [Clostridia bacterium]|nr:hypothetical protein [Clostridia bacterium]
MDDISRREYEEWLQENNVPDYKRALYNDDPRLVMSAVKREQEQARKRREEEAVERGRIAEIEREKTGTPRKNAGIYAEPDEPGAGETETFFSFEETPAADGGEGEIPEDAKDDARSSYRTKPLYGADPAEEKKKKKEKEPKAEAKKPKKKKKTGKAARAGKFVLAAAAAVIVVLIIGISIVNSVDYGSYKLGYVTIGEVTEEGAATAYFVRSSESLFSTASGIFMPVMAEGDRVEAGGTVGYIVKEDDRGILKKLKQVNKDILVLTKIVNDTVTSESDEKLSQIDAKINEQRALLTEMARNGNLDGCGDIENTINTLVAERNAIRLESVSGSDSILSLQREKEDLEKIVKEKMVPVKSEKAGIVSFKISDSENVENELYESFVKNDGSARLSSLSLLDNAGVHSKEDANVAPGDKVCKVICDQNYYVILKITKAVSTLEGFLTVKNSDLTYQATGQIGDNLYVDQGCAVMSTMRGLRNCLDKKSVDVTYDVSKSSGYCVPLTALTDWDANNTTARLAVVKAGYVQFVYVGIKAYDSEKAIITSTPFEGAVVVDPEGTPISETEEPTVTAGTCYVIDSKRVHDGQKIS